MKCELALYEFIKELIGTFHSIFCTVSKGLAFEFYVAIEVKTDNLISTWGYQCKLLGTSPHYTVPVFAERNSALILCFKDSA